MPSAAGEKELDEVFLQHITTIKEELAKVVSRHDILRIKKWITALSEPTTQLMWKKNRNLHSFALAEMLSSGKIEHPFTSLPPNPLQNFPTHCNVRITQSYRQSSSATSPIADSPEEARIMPPRPYSAASVRQRSPVPETDSLPPNASSSRPLQRSGTENSRSRPASAGKQKGFDSETKSTTMRRNESRTQREQVGKVNNMPMTQVGTEESSGLRTLTFQDANNMTHADLVHRVLQEQAQRLRSQSTISKYVSRFGPLPGFEEESRVENKVNEGSRVRDTSLLKDGNKADTPLRPWDKPKVFTSESEKKRDVAEKSRNRMRAEQLASAKRVVNFDKESSRSSIGKGSKDAGDSMSENAPSRRQKASTDQVGGRKFDEEEEFLLFLEDFERDILQLTKS